MIDCGALQRHGISEIGIAGYPDGHPRIAQQELDRALADKIEAAAPTGLAVHIVTQFCFDAAPILRLDRRACAISASIIRCGSGLPARPASRR